MTRRDYVITDPDGGGLVVHWDAGVCTHSAVCVRSLSRVFNPRRRPWIDISAADSSAIEQTVAACPSGALTSTRYGAGQTAPTGTSANAEAVAAEREAPGAASVSVKVLPNGPYLLKGEIEVVDGAGAVARRITKVALCRCGHSGSKPFCDGSHHTRGFTDPAVIAPE